MGRENEVGTVVVDAALAVHRRTGPGLLESVYETILAAELRDRGLAVLRQVGIPVRDGRRLGYLLNFGAPLMKAGIHRCVNHLPE
jgi:hypothetical protein